ncbi:MAG: YicC/YloC family endoribonuclease [Bacteroidota bacterium]|nr:YicC/YloC family endoribonuclease [Bacteroidota bacterium]
MIHSMTGYHKLSFDYLDKTIQIEIKSLNSKYLDISTRIPAVYKEKEMHILDMIKKHLQRGKIEYSIHIDTHKDAEMAPEINNTVFTSYYRQLERISKNNNIPMDENIMQVISKMPDILKQKEEEISTEEWNTLMSHTEKAIEKMQEYRINEGGSMHDDMLSSINKIKSLIPEIETYEKERMKSTKNRLLTALNNLDSKADYDKNRFEQELIYYLEKLDINEEKVRLTNHCDYFIHTLNNDDMPGKKLGFISQEMGREINTLGSKANEMHIQKMVVEMKEELEKIKEMILNVL